MPFRQGLRVHSKDLAVAFSFAGWAALSLAAFLLARRGWQVLATPIVLTSFLLTWSEARRHLRSFLLVLLGLYGGLVLLEVGLRLKLFGVEALTAPTLYGPYNALVETSAVQPSDDPALLFTLTPSYQGRMMGQELRVNRLGFRGPEAKPARQPGVPRVLACGTSITMGAGVSEEAAYPAVLSSSLTQALGKPVEVFNVGVGAYSMAQVFANAKKRAVELHPDVVVIEVSPGGLYETGAAAGQEMGKSAPAAISFVERYSFAANALYPPANLRAKLAGLWPRSKTKPSAPSTNPTAFLETQLTQLAMQGKTQGFSVVLLLVRPMSRFNEAELEGKARAHLKQVAAQLEVSVADLYPAFTPEELPDGFIVFPGDLHPNAAAHARFAAVLLPLVQARLEKK